MMSSATETTATATSQLRSFRNVELCKAGTWGASTGRVTITRADLAAAVAASRRLPYPTIKIGHTDPRFDGEPALGRVVNLRLADKGATLVGDLVDIPAWLAAAMPTAFSQRSIEAVKNFTNNAITYRFVITGLALLGADWPAVTDLPSLQKQLAQEGADA